jgi:hypothetical protein
MVALLRTPPAQPYPRPADSQWARYSPMAMPKGAERRVFPRKEISAEVKTKRLDHSLTALREPNLTLSLRDLSLGGLSAISSMPLQKGERLTVSFPAQGLSCGGLRGGWDAVGRVLRCDASGLGYRVAVEFESLPNAA